MTHPRAAIGCCLAAVVIAAPGQAAAPSSPCTADSSATPLIASSSRLGKIDLYFFGGQGAPVDYYECVGDRAIALGRRSSAGVRIAIMWRARTWRCTRLSRRFAATATLADGSVLRGTDGLRTRSCAQRFALAVPRRVAPGALARIRIRDGWRVGRARTQLCTTRPAGRPACRQLTFTTPATRTRTFRPRKRGVWRVELRVPGHVSRASIAVGVRPVVRDAPPPRLLATGDSTMDGLDSALADRLGDEATVTSDVDPGIAVSKADAWQPIAVKQVERLKPRTTVVSIGANEGWPMRGADGALHECCDEQWIDEYARRTRRTMLTYGKRVFWCTIVAPKEERRVPIFDAVNTAILRAAQGLANVRVVRMDQVFTPRGYTEAIRYDGRDVRVREPDGIHLNDAGAQIAAREVIKALKAAGR